MGDRSIRPPSGDAVTISALFPNVPLLTEAPDALMALVAKIEEHAARVALHYLGNVLADAVPIDTGELAQSFQADPATATGGIELTGVSFAEEGVVGRIFSSLPQAAVMDEGRRPGSPVNRAGIEALTSWAERKLGVTGKEAVSAAFAIAATIRAKGMTGTNYADRALQIAEPQLTVIFANAGEAIAAALVGA